MKKLSYFSFLIVLLAISSGCSPRYSNTIYAPVLIEDLKIAILPYEVLTTGRITEMLSEEEIEEIEDVERLAFQKSMYYQLLNRLERSPYNSNVVIQYYGETNNLLAEAQKSPDEVYKMQSGELAELLGVDAVIRSEVHKHTYLTNMESYGISVARSLLIIFGDHYPWYLPGSETGDIRISSSIVRGETGVTLWAASKRASTDWDRDTYETIERINHRITKRIPL